MTASCTSPCWGLGEIRQYDVSNPLEPIHTDTIEIGGIARHKDHPSGKPWAGGPQMIEISRDGRRIYATNSLYSTWDPQFYPRASPEQYSKQISISSQAG